MRPKTFPATSYPGNSRQRLQEIREVLKPPPMPSGQSLPCGPECESQPDLKASAGKDAARQQQIRAVPKFGPYQKALREIRNSLLPFANETGHSTSIEVNRQMLQELVNAGCDQEMAIRALKQTGSRNIDAALDYISKMGYLDPRNEQIVRVIKQTSPGKGGGSSPVDHRPVLEGPSDAMSHYHQMGNPGGYGAESTNMMGEIPRPYMNVPVVNYIMPSSQAAIGSPMQRPSSIGPYTAISAQNPPGNSMYLPCDLKHQQKPYPTNMEQAMMIYSIPSHSGQPLQLQGAPGPSSPHYVRQHMMGPAETSGYGVKRSPSFQNKIQQESNYGSLQSKGSLGQNSTGYSFQQSPSNLYLPPHTHHRQSSPTSHQVHMISRASAMGTDFQDVPQNLLTPSRASLNMDLYDHQVQHWLTPSPTRHESLPNPGPEAQVRQQQGPFRGEVHGPSRSGSFKNHQQKVHVTVRQPDTSLAPPNTITAVTSSPILQPVISIRVMRPEPEIAVGPCHPGWLPAQSQALENSELMDQHSYAAAGAEACSVEPIDCAVQEPRCPPPPYPKNLLLPSNSEQQMESNTWVVPSLISNKCEDISGGEKNDKASSKGGKAEKAMKDKKQIQTSPVPVRYTQLCDWWSVGVILFEMLIGQPPFLASTPTETQLKVINWENTLQIPPQVKLSQEAVDIISRLCCAAEERLGRNGTGEIKEHSFFEKMDFSSNLRTQPAPFLPKISHPMDTSNFDPVEEDSPWKDSGDSTKTWDTLSSSHSKHPEHAFYEFTFRRFFDDNGCPFRYPKPPENVQSSQDQTDRENQDSEDQCEGCEPVYV
ncbi:UNVERIFIED_CONTAM: hypothetical protein FKN15_053631 [Acipenser sinensis]